MDTKKFLTVLGIAATFFGIGITMVFLTEIVFRIIGALVCVVSFIIPIALVIYYKFKSIETINIDYKNQLTEGIKSYHEQIDHEMQKYTSTLSNIISRSSIDNDALFIRDGYIGLQKQINILESSSEIGNGNVRMCISGHLPSYMRLKDLSNDMGSKLYKSWKPPNMVKVYVDLINQRRHAFQNFIEKGGIARDIFYKNDIYEYIHDGCTFHDNVEDPIEEMEERISALLSYIKHDNYYICLIDEKRTSPNFLLKQGYGLVVDMRTTEVDAHFTNTVDGLYTNSKDIIKEFERKFELNWHPDHQTNKRDIERFLQDLLSNKIAEFKRKREDCNK